jgi:serine/threonine-protein kinase
MSFFQSYQSVSIALLVSSVIACSNDDATTNDGASGAGGNDSAGGSGASVSGGNGNSGGNNASGGQSHGGQNDIGGQTAGGQSNSGGSDGNPNPNGPCGPGLPLFPVGAAFNTPIDTAPLDAESDEIIDYLSSNHTADARFQVDFSITILTGDSQTPHRAFTPTDEHYSPDCDTAPVPVPTGGALEGEDGFACESDGDCHLIVVDTEACKLYEMWRANIDGDDFYGGCLAIWSTDQVYPATGRGEYCTSADGAGLPIAPLTFNPDEIAAGSIGHAIRFILPNDLIRADIYVHPGTHSTSSTSGDNDAPPYSARLRLKADADLSALNPAATIVAHALQKYGMILADGGNVTFTAASDRGAAHTWDEVGFDAQDLKSLNWDDFEVVELGERFNWHDGDCDHTPIE